MNEVLQRLHGRGFPGFFVAGVLLGFFSGGFGLFFSSWIFALILFASSTSGSFASSSSYFWRISSVSFWRTSSGGSVFWISGVVQEREISSCDGGVSVFFSWTCSWIFFASARVTFLMFAMMMSWGYWINSPEALRSSVVLLSRYLICVLSCPRLSSLRSLFSPKWTTTWAKRSFLLWAVRYVIPSSLAISLSFFA